MSLFFCWFVRIGFERNLLGEIEWHLSAAMLKRLWRDKCWFPLFEFQWGICGDRTHGCSVLFCEDSRSHLCLGRRVRSLFVKGSVDVLCWVGTNGRTNGILWGEFNTEEGRTWNTYRREFGGSRWPYLYCMSKHWADTWISEGGAYGCYVSGVGRKLYTNKHVKKMKKIWGSR